MSIEADGITGSFLQCQMLLGGVSRTAVAAAAKASTSCVEVTLAVGIEVLVLFFAGHGNLSAFEADSLLYPPNVGDMRDHNISNPNPHSQPHPDRTASQSTKQEKQRQQSIHLLSVPSQT